MAVVNINLTCELQEAVKVQYIDGVLFSQDNQANKINVTVLDGGQPATLSGTVSANIVRSDGGTVAATGGSITGNVASITLPAAAYAVPGIVSIAVKLTASGVITTIAAIVGNMYRSSTDTAIDPGTVIPSIQTLISQINAAVASIPADYSALWTKLAPAFSTSASYVAGQYVTYNSGLYRFNTTHTGDWSSSDVTAVNLGGEITDLKSAFKYTEDVLRLYPVILSNTSIYITYGNNFNAGSYSATRVSSKPIYVRSGETCHVKATGFGKFAWVKSEDGVTITDAQGSWITESSIDLKFTGPIYFRLAFAKADDGAISYSDVSMETSPTIADDIESIKIALALHGTCLVPDYIIENATLSAAQNSIVSSQGSNVGVFSIKKGCTYYIKRFCSSSVYFLTSNGLHTTADEVQLTGNLDNNTTEKTYTNSDGYNYLYIATKIAGNAPYASFVMESVKELTEGGYVNLEYYSKAKGYMKTDGTLDTFGGTILKYKKCSPVVILNGSSSLSVGYSYLWFVTNGEMIGHLDVTENPMTFSNKQIQVPNNAEEIWLYDKSTPTNTLKAYTIPDYGARNKIDVINIRTGDQWKGKKWYAYGTSITSVHEGTGKYPTYLAQMSGMILTEKGYGGGGIGNLGAYSQGQVYDMICNITDGKLEADIITLETGANDIATSVPLGDVFDTGTSTLAGCLNDCIHYLQENTTAQICIIPSPCGTTTINKAFQWAEMIRQICDINRVTLLSPNDNIGRAKALSQQGSLYLVDNIHQTDLGGYVLAEYLWYQLRNIPLFYTAIPT